MTESVDHYAVLGVAPSATNQQILSAYRKLARRHHPDLNRNDPDAVRRFKRVTASFEVLYDALKRSRYDSQRLRDQAARRLNRAWYDVDAA